MSDKESELPEKIRRALKESPTLRPPESFYRAILQRIERRSGGAEERTKKYSPALPLSRSPAHWLWGWPARALATACVLMVIVLVTRETRKPELETKVNPLSRDTWERVQGEGTSEKQKANVPSSSPSPTFSGRREISTPHPSAKEPALMDQLAETKEVRSRRKEKSMHLGYGAADGAKKNEGAKPRLWQREDVVTQARDTVGGVASQGSFMEADRARLKSRVAAKAKEGNLAPAASAPIEKGMDAWNGQTSGVTSPRTVVVRTPEEWQALWREHTRKAFSSSSAPPLDFDHSIVVGVFAGTKPTAGYAVEITTIRELPDRVEVEYRQTTPPPGALTAQVLTQPYHFRVIPRTELPVKFQEIK